MINRPNTRQCPICDFSPVPDDQENCPNCGTWLGIVEPEEEEVPPVEEVQESQTPAPLQEEQPTPVEESGSLEISSEESPVEEEFQPQIVPSQESEPVAQASLPVADEEISIKDKTPVLVAAGTILEPETAEPGPEPSPQPEAPEQTGQVEFLPGDEKLPFHEGVEERTTSEATEDVKVGQEKPRQSIPPVVLVLALLVVLIACFACYRGGVWLIEELGLSQTPSEPVETILSVTVTSSQSPTPSQTPEPSDTPTQTPTLTLTSTITRTPVPSQTPDVSAFPSYTWRSSIIDRNQDTGVYTSQAIDPKNGAIHIAYFDDTKGDLRYALYSQGGWIPETVEEEKDVGYSPSLALDAQGRPHIAYFDRGGNLKYARRSGNRWEIVTVSSGVGMTTAALVLDAQDRPLILYLDANQTALVLAQRSGSGWLRNKVVDASPSSYSVAMVKDTAGNLHVSYYDFGLNYIQRLQNKWSQAVTLEDEPGIGVFSSLALDEAGNPHISYFDENTNQVRYTAFLEETWTPPVTIDPSVEAGIFNAIAIDPQGFIHVVYADAAEHALRLAIGKAGSWKTEILDPLGPTNHWMSLSLTKNGLPEISYFDAQSRILRHLSASQVKSGSGQQLQPDQSPTVVAVKDTDTPEPFQPQLSELVGGGGLIAFFSDRSGNNDLYTMRADGSDVTQLTTFQGDDRVPSWSPDGREIAYQSYQQGDYEIFVIDLANRSTRQVTANGCDDYAPAWSPDGRRFAYYSNCDGNREIYVMNVDGSGARQLTYTDEVYNWFPVWSPDGKQITFSSNRSGKYFIYVMNADGSGVRQVERGCVSSFSPDGRKLVFASYCTDYGDIFMVDVDGSDLVQITQNGRHRNPGWSRDGQSIVYQSYQSGNDDIWIMGVSGEAQTQLTNEPGIDGAPVWQP